MPVSTTADSRGSKKLGGEDGQESARAHYSGMLNDVRMSLQAAGYEATVVRFDAGRPHRKLKAFKELKDREAFVEDWQIDLQLRERDAALVCRADSARNQMTPVLAPASLCRTASTRHHLPSKARTLTCGMPLGDEP